MRGKTEGSGIPKGGGGGCIIKLFQYSFGTGRDKRYTNLNIVVGAKGGLERVKELRMEMVCTKDKLAAVAETIKRVHPYEVHFIF